MSRGEIPAGSDFLQTVPQGTVFHFNEIPIPAGFFTNDSQAFTETVKFRGRPLPRSFFNGQDITHVDTIVARKESLQLPPPYPCSQTIPIEMIGLALESVDPIQVRTGNGTEFWDVRVELSNTRRSTGSMTIRKTQREGGSFDSELTVFPTFRFIRKGNGREKVLDVGALPLPPDIIEKITLRASNSSWVHFAPKKLTLRTLNDGFVPGVRSIQGISKAGVVSESDDEFTETSASCAHQTSSAPECPPPQRTVTWPAAVTRPFRVRGATLKDVGRELNKRSEWGLTIWKPTYKVVSTCQGLVNRLTITVPITIEMPVWEQLEQQGKNTRAEWQRMLQRLTVHENEHVAIARRHFNDELADNMLDTSESYAKDIFEAAKIDAQRESDQYDDRTQRGKTEGVYLDTSITN